MQDQRDTQFAPAPSPDHPITIEPAATSLKLDVETTVKQGDKAKREIAVVPDRPSDVRPSGELTVHPHPVVGDFTGTWRRIRGGKVVDVLTLSPDGSVLAQGQPPGAQGPNTYEVDGEHDLFTLKFIDGNDTDNVQTIARGRVRSWKEGMDGSTFELEISDGKDKGKTDEFHRDAEDRAP